MKSYIEKREILCSLAEAYLDTRENSYISVSDGIMDSHDFDSISFLMLLALTYSNQEVTSIYSMDIEVSEDIRIYFVDKEYSKIVKLKEDIVVLGKTVLNDAKKFYKVNYGKQDDDNIDEIITNFRI